MENMKFNYNSLEELIKDTKQLGLSIPFSEDISVLRSPLNINGKVIPNRLGVNPMEGCDGTSEGKPGELTFRRYERFAKGGSGLLWLEATAVVNEGRANPRQIFICENNKEEFKKLVGDIDKSAGEEFGEDYKPYKVVQLTHSGRYSRPNDNPVPQIVVNNPYLDKFLPRNHSIISDEQLEELENYYVQAAILAKECGFDAVDIKSCHRYLNSELLSGFTREGKYGGTFKNRTRFLLNIIDKIKKLPGDKIDITLRLNVYDAIPYPYGWGVSKEDFHKEDLREPIELIKILYEKGVKLVNISCGNPYYNPHVGRPYDMGPYIPAEPPVSSAAKMLNIIRQIQESAPDMAVVATGLSWFKDYAPFIAAGGIKNGWFKIAGFGRQSFAYPDFAKDILQNGKMDRKKCCIACSKCTEIMRDKGRTGCVIRDSEIYAPIYRAGREGKKLANTNIIAEHL